MRFAIPFLFLVACGGGDAGGDSGASTTASGTTTTADCGATTIEASTGPCLIAQLAGTYDVTATSGTHTRGTVTVEADGTVRYDDGLDFLAPDMEGVYDRLDCCERISVEMTQRADNDTSLAPDARHRVDFFVDANSLPANLVSLEYYPNWPASDGLVVLTVD